MAIKTVTVNRPDYISCIYLDALSCSWPSLSPCLDLAFSVHLLSHKQLSPNYFSPIGLSFATSIPKYGISKESWPYMVLLIGLSRYVCLQNVPSNLLHLPVKFNHFSHNSSFTYCKIQLSFTALSEILSASHVVIPRNFSCYVPDCIHILIGYHNPRPASGPQPQPLNSSMLKVHTEADILFWASKLLQFILSPMHVFRQLQQLFTN